jgi:hypothetical protein
MILRLVSTRQSLPPSMRASVSAEMPALRASSALVRSCSSRITRTLFMTRLVARFAAPAAVFLGSERAAAREEPMRRARYAIAGGGIKKPGARTYLRV